ncbi:MAG: endo-1,4-beta-xylanase [Sedimentisphaerales bacterium]|nr:endo-1,4-beta-xylanase [Sedimentisphaerales bacterium]
MSLLSMVLFFFIITLVISVCFGQDEVLGALTPEAVGARIADIRMGDIVIKTRPGAEVRIEQVRHEFLFGTAIPDSLAEKDPKAMSADDREKYLKVLEENFNYAVHENALKWYDCEKEYKVVDYYTADRIWELCHERNIPMRGHCIFWDMDELIMPWLKALNNDELRGAVVRRGLGVTRHFKGRIEEFDLNNEMIHNDFFRRRLGYGIINEMAWIAKAGNPDATLYVNDYGVLDMGYNAHAYTVQIENLLASGVPIGGIGCQAHLAYAEPTITPGTHVQKTLDRLAQFNLPIKITECLFMFNDEETRVAELKKLFPIYFAHPGVEAILIWGFWEGDHWQPHSAMWKKDWSVTPQAMAYRDLVYNQWWTDISDKADSRGVIKARAFYGDYQITSNGKSRKVTLSKKDKSLQVAFE